MKKFGLLGEKLSHSWSCLIHSIIYDQYDLDANYELLECSENDLKEYITLLRQGVYTGFNVTIPYKKTIMKYLDEVSELALKIGSVNTIYLKDGKVIGTNTDYYGFKEELSYYNVDCVNKMAYVLGTGGASLAISSVLKDLGAKVIIVSRTPITSSISYEDLNEKNDIDILVNTTPVGMFPKVGYSPVSEEVAKKSKVVVDIIFNPLKTKLLEDANSDYHGLYMLVGQAIEAERIWFDLDINISIGDVVDEVIRRKGL